MNIELQAKKDDEQNYTTLPLEVVSKTNTEEIYLVEVEEGSTFRFKLTREDSIQEFCVKIFVNAVEQHFFPDVNSQSFAKETILEKFFDGKNFFAPIFAKAPVHQEGIAEEDAEKNNQGTIRVEILQVTDSTIKHRNDTKLNKSELKAEKINEKASKRFGVSIDKKIISDSKPAQNDLLRTLTTQKFKTIEFLYRNPIGIIQERKKRGLPEPVTNTPSKKRAAEKEALNLKPVKKQKLVETEKTNTSLREWFATLDPELRTYVDVFEKEEIDEKAIVHVGHNELKEMGITKIGHRIKLLEAIQKKYKQERIIID